MHRLGHDDGALQDLVQLRQSRAVQQGRDPVVRTNAVLGAEGVAVEVARCGHPASLWTPVDPL
ncbi:hypothetical protein ACFFX0_11880 [Citricoccus parietis]|uniref:Uncharacterized protein n=1 Tax=Citricoccus parietis TaxID=592307 RepID=A0ABV5G050_9MICC